MILREAAESDFELISEISQSIYSSIANKALFNWPGAVLRGELQNVKTMVVEANCELVSFLCYRDLPDLYEISVLATRFSVRNKNFQTALIEFLQRLAAKQRKSIMLEVHHLNLPAQRLYQKTGFLLVNSRRNYYSDGAEALVMKWTNDKAGC